MDSRASQSKTETEKMDDDSDKNNSKKHHDEVLYRE